MRPILLCLRGLTEGPACLLKFLFSPVYKRSRLFPEGFYFSGLTEASSSYCCFLSSWVNRRPRLFIEVFVFAGKQKRSHLFIAVFIFLGFEHRVRLFIGVFYLRRLKIGPACFLNLLVYMHFFVLWTSFALRVVSCCYILVTLLPIDGSVFLLFTWVAYSICFLVYGSTQLFSLLNFAVSL